MYMKRYTIAILILIAMIGWVVYSNTAEMTVTMDIFGVVLPTTSVTVLVVVCLVILYVASVLHMSFYSLLATFKLRKYTKDYDKFVDAIIEAFLAKKERSHVFKTPRYQLLGSIVDNSTMFPTQTLGATTQNEKLDAVLKDIKEIRDGSVVDLKAYNLKAENALVVQNERNRYKKGDLTAENILNHSSIYSATFVSDIYTDYVKTASYSSIEQYKEFLTKESLDIILSRVNSTEHTLKISNEALILLLNTLDLDADELVQTSITLSATMIPEQRIKLYETLSESRTDAIEAYLYTLFDLEMLSPASELLDNTQANEYLNFKAYKALKDGGNNFNINLFV